MADNNILKARRDFEARLGSLRDRFGDRNVARFASSVFAMNPSAETLEKMAASAVDFLKMQPSDEMVKSVTRMIDKANKSGLFKLISELSIEKLAIVLAKRNEEFTIHFLKMCNELFSLNPVYFMAALNDQPFKELIFFSNEGLRKWVENGKEKFCKPGSNETFVPEFFRYCTMCKGYDDVAEYKISEYAVFLETVQDALTQFAMHMFDRRLIAAKSKTHVPHVTETDELHVYLPDHIAHFKEKEDNTSLYFMTTMHEGSHIHRGSFILDIFRVTQMLEEKGVKVKNLELKPDGLRIKNVQIVDMDGKEHLCLSMLHLLPFLCDPRHAGVAKHLWNVIDDLRVDCAWLDEQAPGYRRDRKRMMEEFFFEKGIRKLPTDLTVTNFFEGLIFTTEFLSLTMQRREFLHALRTGDCSALSDNDDVRLVGKLRAMHPEILQMVLQFENELLDLATARQRNGTKSFIYAIKIYNKIKHLLDSEATDDRGENDENLDNMSGPISLTDLDPDNVELSMDPADGEEGKGIDLDDLPEELREKLKKKFDEKFKDMSDEDKKKLADQVAKNAGRMDKDDKDGAQKPRDQRHIPGRWDIELVDGVEVLDYNTIQTTRLTECRSMADARTALNIRNTALRIMVKRLREFPGELAGEVDPSEYLEWKRARGMGILLPRDYHLGSEIIKSRSVAIMVVGDASGSTASTINGKRKIDYITGSVHTFAEALEPVPGIAMAYGFFNSYGRERIYFYEGRKFGEPLRFAKVEPNNANRDGAIIRKAGSILVQQPQDVKIGIFIVDSMPADDDNYNGRRGVEDVRHATLELIKAGILPFVITVPPDSSYYSGMFKSAEEYLDYIYRGRENYFLIKSEKECDKAFGLFVETNLPKLRRVERV